ncbi:hypothetical protein [Saccharopolyspora cebuensis]|uniref:DUF5872 domain-containing protein n=1 Tax=Saccharopolyspora cebuensis TaxID=418759 RepID=A0ABV4CRK3_9PSEU
MAKSRKDYRDTYTEPELRERLKEEVKASDKGAAPGRWSARKSQLLTQAYERHGGGYRNPGRKTSSQRSLERWTEQEWQTASGSARARHGDRTERYLPKQAWEELTEGQRRETEQQKRDTSRRGRQHASNPPAAKSARRMAELDELPAQEAVQRARTFAPEEAERALRHEREHKARKTVLGQLSKRIDRGR